MIVVLDTNVWISALVFSTSRGIPRQVLQRASAQDVIAKSREIEAELYLVLTKKFQWEVERADTEVQPFLVGSLLVELQGTVHRCRDPKDDIFLECAERANADLLVAGDKDLLVLGSHKQTRIVTPAQYLAIER